MPSPQYVCGCVSHQERGQDSRGQIAAGDSTSWQTYSSDPSQVCTCTQLFTICCHWYIEGLVRPCATELPSWIYTYGFLLSSSCQTHDESSLQQALTEAWAKASKYSAISDIFGPMCIFGLALGRQPSHVAINQGGTTADHGCLQTLDALHSTRDKRWSFRSHLYMSSTWRSSILQIDYRLYGMRVDMKMTTDSVWPISLDHLWWCAHLICGGLSKASLALILP